MKQGVAYSFRQANLPRNIPWAMLLGSQVIPLANNSRSGHQDSSLGSLGVLESWYDHIHIPFVLTLSECDKSSDLIRLPGALVTTGMHQSVSDSALEISDVFTCNHICSNYLSPCIIYICRVYV